MTTPTPETLAAAKELARKVTQKQHTQEDTYLKLAINEAHIATALTQHARKLAVKMVKETGAEEALNDALISLIFLNSGAVRTDICPANAEITKAAQETVFAALARLRALTEDKP